jgi:hypothetical protein
VLEAFELGVPGLQGMGWLGALADKLAIKLAGGLLEVHQFADGNASIVRLLLHKLIPAVAPGTSDFEGIATSRFDYRALDRDDQQLMPLHDDMRCPVPPRGFESYESPDSERKYERADAVTRRQQAVQGERRQKRPSC